MFSPIAYNHLVTSGVPLPCRCILIQHKPTCYHELTQQKEVSHFIQLIFPLALVAFGGHTPCHTRVVSAHPLASDLIAPPSSAHLLPRSLIAQTLPTSRSMCAARKNCSAYIAGPFNSGRPGVAFVHSLAYPGTISIRTRPNLSISNP